EVCFDNRITSVPAAFRPKGIFTATDQLGAALPAGSTVTATVHMQSSEPAAASLEGVLKATDREVGRSTAVQQVVSPAGWTAFELELTTDRLVAAGEQLTFHLVHAGVRSWAYGYNGDHASSLTITPAAAPAEGNEFGVTVDQVTADGGTVVASGAVAFPDLGPDPQLAGFHAPSLRVQVAVDDPGFRAPTYADVDPATGTWTATVPATGAGEVAVRALRDRFPSAVTSVVLEPDDAEDGQDGEDDRPGRRRPDGPGRWFPWR
ncbi:MAG: hypothetical protein JXA83_06390, partial [Acidimicrobiales bacterium]|nr:hypothetical protein [Acidimicrobiales bacterium]